MHLSFFDQFIAISMLALIAYVTYSSVKQNPQQFTASALNKSTRKMGILALLLIGFIAMLYMMLPPGGPIAHTTREIPLNSTQHTHQDRSL